jgi:hypothetical protein
MSTHSTITNSDSSNDSDDEPTPPPISVKMRRRMLRRRFIPLKNPLIKDIPQPIDFKSTESLCKSFLDTMEKDWKEQEQRTEVNLQQMQKEIKEMHKKCKSMYVELFQNLLNYLNDDDNKVLLETILLLIEHADYSEGLSAILKHAIQFINEGKRPALIHDNAQYVYGTKPLYFDFEFFDD